MRSVFLLALLGLAACEQIPMNTIIVACGIGPAQFPQYAEEILLACAELTAESRVQLTVPR